MQFDLCHYPPLTYYKFSEYLRKVISDVLKKFCLIIMVVGHYTMFFTLLQHEQTFFHTYIHTLLRRIMLTYKCPFSESVVQICPICFLLCF